MSAAEPAQVVGLPPRNDVPPPDAGGDICDEEFIKNLKQLKRLRTFLIEQAVPLKPTEAPILSFRELNLLRYKHGGRTPTEQEWSALEELTQDLFGHLTEPLRRQFIYGQITWWVPGLVLGLGFIAFSTLWLTAHLWGKDYEVLLIAYIVWSAALGAIGAMSFIGMNALAVQNDATFDLTNVKLIILRTSLGALFGILLTIPFGFSPYIKFIETVSSGGTTATSSITTSTITFDSLVLLLPFIFGFSTTLVIMVLNQFVDAVQSFFGKRTSQAVPAQVVPTNPGASASTPAK